MIELADIACRGLEFHWKNRLKGTHGEMYRNTVFFENMAVLSGAAGKIGDDPYLTPQLKDEMDYLTSLWVCVFYNRYSDIFPIKDPEILECVEMAKDKMNNMTIPKLISEVHGVEDIALSIVDSRINSEKAFKTLKLSIVNNYTTVTNIPKEITYSGHFGETSQFSLSYLRAGHSPHSRTQVMLSGEGMGDILIHPISLAFCLVVAELMVARMYDNSVEGMVQSVENCSRIANLRTELVDFYSF